MNRAEEFVRFLAPPSPRPQVANRTRASSQNVAPSTRRFLMDAARISTLLEPYIAAPLPPATLDRISTYIDLLLRWNARTNLTAVRNPEEIVTRHFGESLFAARSLFPAINSEAPRALEPQSSMLPSADGSPALSTLIDVGSGAGFPGIPIHMFVPGLRTTLIEAHHKKVAFLREVIRVLTLTGID